MVIKSTFRLIKSTLNRFIAILAIVLIGVSFMMGLLSNYDIMKLSVEEKYQENKIFDIQIYSLFGFDDNDINELKKEAYVGDIYASKTRDTFLRDKDNQEYVTRIAEVETNLNKIELVEGRMPSSANECVMIGGYTAANITIGSEVQVFLKEEAIEDSLKNTKFKVVGIVKSIEQLSKVLSTSLLDNKELEMILYVPNNNFISEYYTTLYVRLADTDNYDTFSEEYDNYVDECRAKLDKFSSEHSSDFRDKIYEQAMQQLEEGRKLFEEEKAKGEKELADAKALLDQAKAEVEAGKKEIADNEAKLIQARADYNAGYQQYLDGLAQLEEIENQIQDIAFTDIETLFETLSAYYRIYRSMTTLEDELLVFENAMNETRDLANVFISDNGNPSLDDVLAQIDSSSDVTSPEFRNLQAVAAALVFVSNFDDIVVGAESATSTYDDLFKYTQDYIEAELGFSVESIYNSLDGYYQQYEEGVAQLAQAKVELEQADKQITDGYKQLEDGKAELAKGIKEYEAGLVEYEEGLATFKREIRNGQDELEDGEKQIEKIGTAEWIILNRYDMNYSTYMYRSTCEQMRMIGLIIPILFFVVAALVCATTMTRLIDEQRNQIGIYRALGFKKGEITSIYLLYVIFASLFASVFAIGIGVVVFPSIIYTTWRLMYDLPDIHIIIPPLNVVICVLSFTILMMIVAYIVIASSLKEQPAQLLRPKPPKNTKRIFLEKWTWLWNKLAFISKVTARNIFRYFGRFVMTVIGVAGCTSLLLLGWGIKDSIGSMIELQFSEIETYDYQVCLDNDRHIDEILSILEEDKGNTKILPYGDYSSMITTEGSNKERNAEVLVLNPSTQDKVFYFEDIVTHEGLKASDTGVYVTQKFAENEGIAVGDRITVESFEGTKKEVTVEAIVKNYIMHYIIFSETGYKNTFGEDVEYTKISIDNSGDISALISLQEEYRDISAVVNQRDNTEVYQNMITALDYIIIIIILVAGALAFVVLINLTNVNISERIREIATFKVLGFKDKEIDACIFKEIGIMSVIGAILGLPLGVIESRYVMTEINVDMVMFPNHIAPISFVYAFVITIVFTIIVMLLTKKQLRNVKMVESLKSIE